MNSDIKNDIEILEIALKKINSFTEKKILLGKLINILENCLAQLKTVDRNWKKTFRVICLDLDAIYSEVLEQVNFIEEDGRKFYDPSGEILSKEDQSKVNELLEEIRRLCITEIGELKKIYVSTEDEIGLILNEMKSQINDDSKIIGIRELLSWNEPRVALESLIDAIVSNNIVVDTQNYKVLLEMSKKLEISPEKRNAIKHQN